MRQQLKPIRFAEPLRRGCEEEVIFLLDKVEFTYNDTDQKTGEKLTHVDLTDKKVWLTVKDVLWDEQADDETAVFKVLGVIDEPEAEDIEKETWRVRFPIDEHDTYKLDPRKRYFADIIITDSDGTSHPKPYGTYVFDAAAGPNNAQAGGLEDE